MRLLIHAAYAGLSMGFGMALGQRGELGFVQTIFTAVIPIATLVLAFVSKQGRLAVVATGLAMLCGLLIGQQQFRSAWNECTTQAEEARQSLVRFERETGSYPARLEEIAGTLPCRCGFRTTILHYMANDRGFRLWFANDRQIYAGTHRTPVTAIERSSTRPLR